MERSGGDARGDGGLDGELVAGLRDRAGGPPGGEPDEDAPPAEGWARLRRGGHVDGTAAVLPPVDDVQVAVDPGGAHAHRQVAPPP